MIGLAYLLFFALYLLLSAYVVYRATLYARCKYGKGWAGGWLAAFVMYNLVFWDWIPVYVMHKYYCATEAGFWVYKTPEHWFKENPEAKGALWGDDYYWSRDKRANEPISGGERYWVSDYIASEWQNLKVFHAVGRREKVLTDFRTGKVLARMVDYYRGSASLAGGANSLVDYKIWLAAGQRNCTSFDGYLENQFNSFSSVFYHIESD